MIDKLKTRGGPGDETRFVLRDPDQTYTHSEVCDIVEKAELLGFELDLGTALDGMTVRELNNLVNRRQ